MDIKIKLQLLIILSYLSIALANINISGDMRIRPRIDIIEVPSMEKSNDFLYMYRARINFNVELDSNYFVKTKIGTNDLSALSKMSDPTENSTNGTRIK